MEQNDRYECVDPGCDLVLRVETPPGTNIGAPMHHGKEMRLVQVQQLPRSVTAGPAKPNVPQTSYTAGSSALQDRFKRQ